MEIAPEVTEIEALAEAARVPMAKALARAGVAATTYWRWRNTGIEPHTRTLRKIRQAIAQLEAGAA